MLCDFSDIIKNNKKILNSKMLCEKLLRETGFAMLPASDFGINEKFLISAPLKGDFEDFSDLKKEILSLGFIRFSIWGDIYTINDDIDIIDPKDIKIIIDRLTIKDYSDEESQI